MNLKDFLASRDKPPELYWSLVLEPGWVQAGIWYIAEEKAEVISISPPTAWEVEDELLGAADAALSSAVAKLPEEGKEPNKTVFGVPSSWVKDGEIAEEHLAKIKNLCTELSLSPVGFVVIPEAIAHLAKSEEGSPLSGIVLGLSKDFLEVTVFKLGNLIGTTQVSRSVSLVEDVTEGLSRFEGASPLPSRIIVFDGKEAETNEAKEVLMQESWEEHEKISFLHTPKAEVLPPDKRVLAVSLAGASEIGEVSKVVSVEEEEEPLVGEDVENVTIPETKLAPEELGFTVGEDVTQKQKIAEEKPAPSVTAIPVAPPAQPAHLVGVGINSYLNKTKSLFHGFFPQKFSAPKVTRKPLVTLGILALGLLVVLGLAWWFLPKAKVTIYVTPKSFQEETNITFNTDGVSDPGTGVVPATSIVASVSGDKTKSATGSKLVGDKAKGSVRVQNGTAFPINLIVGMLLVSSGNLKFSLDQAASVSAALSPSSPGTQTLNVTADSIGAEYNLAKDEIFKVGNYPKAEVDATALSDFSGGSSQQISAISKDDQAALETQLMDELTQSAKDQLSAKVSESQYFVGDLAILTPSGESFDHKVGDAADSLKLSLTLDATGIVADKTKLLEFARNLLKDKIPGGYVLRDSQINFKFAFVNNDGNNFIYKADVGANFLPQSNTDDIKKKIYGRNPQVAQNYLNSIPGFTRADVTLSPRLPGIFGTLPHILNNITVEIVAER